MNRLHALSLMPKQIILGDIILPWMCACSRCICYVTVLTVNVRNFYKIEKPKSSFNRKNEWNMIWKKKNCFLRFSSIHFCLSACLFWHSVKLPLKSPGFLRHVLRGFKRAFKTEELISEAACNQNRKSTSKQALAVLIKIHFAFTGF